MVFSMGFGMEFSMEFGMGLIKQQIIFSQVKNKDEEIQQKQVLTCTRNDKIVFTKT